MLSLLSEGNHLKLFINLLCRYHWIQHAAAYNHSYADSGVFCVHASCDPSHLRELVEIVTRELVAMAGNINWVELNRSINVFLSKV
jgi:processing peptidase subunit alpha